MYRTHLTRLQIFHHRMLLQKDGHLQLRPTKKKSWRQQHHLRPFHPPVLTSRKFFHPHCHPRLMVPYLVQEANQLPAGEQLNGWSEQVLVRIRCRFRPLKTPPHPFLHRARRQRRRKS